MSLLLYYKEYMFLMRLYTRWYMLLYMWVHSVSQFWSHWIYKLYFKCFIFSRTNTFYQLYIYTFGIEISHVLGAPSFCTVAEVMIEKMLYTHTSVFRLSRSTFYHPMRLANHFGNVHWNVSFFWHLIFLESSSRLPLILGCCREQADRAHQVQASEMAPR